MFSGECDTILSDQRENPALLSFGKPVVIDQNKRPLDLHKKRYFLRAMNSITHFLRLKTNGIIYTFSLQLLESPTV